MSIVSDLMPTPLSIKSIHLKENDCALFIQFELKLGEAAQETLAVEVTVPTSESTGTIRYGNECPNE